MPGHFLQTTVPRVWFHHHEPPAMPAVKVQNLFPTQMAMAFTIFMTQTNPPECLQQCPLSPLACVPMLSPCTVPYCQVLCGQENEWPQLPCLPASQMAEFPFHCPYCTVKGAAKNVAGPVTALHSVSLLGPRVQAPATCDRQLLWLLVPPRGTG